MKNLALGCLIGLAICAIIAGWGTTPSHAFPNNPRQLAQLPPGSLITHVTTVDKFQQLTVVDPQRRCMAVYYIDSLTGKVSLRSVRNIVWDLEMVAFNTLDPQPQDIRSMLTP